MNNQVVNNMKSIITALILSCIASIAIADTNLSSIPSLDPAELSDRVIDDLLSRKYKLYRKGEALLEPDSKLVSRHPHVDHFVTGALPLKVYILAGQSNMEGHAKVETFDYMGDDAKTAPLLRNMRGRDGGPVVCDRVWISYYTGGRDNHGEGFGKLTAGYGSRSNPKEGGGKIGPEFTFGITMEKACHAPILIIKTAWGGKSLNTDFRPPSAGPYEMPEATRALWAKHPRGAHGIPEDAERKVWWEKKHKATGVYYRMMLEHVRRVLADPGRVCPAYDPEAGYELAGFVWFQGWNDMCDGTTYPHGVQGNRFAGYSELFGHFITDVRKELDAPKLPFVIGVMGVGGVGNARQNDFREAMRAPAAMVEFKGQVVAVETAPFWDEPLGAIDAKRDKVRQMGWFLRSKHKDHPNRDGTMTHVEQQAYVNAFRDRLITPGDEARWKRGASNAGYHYLGCAKTMAQIGQAFAEAMLEMEKE